MVSIPGVPTTAVIDISGWLLSLKAMDQIMSVTTPLWDNTQKALRHIGYPRFRKYWRVGRLLVGLQTRLFVEEVMTFMGRPWSDLKTGFDTISSVGESKTLAKAFKKWKPIGKSEAPLWARRRRAAKKSKRFQGEL